MANHRAISLSNLLDVGMREVELFDKVERQQGALADAAIDTESITSTMRRKVKGTPQWKRKQQVIEAINELIEELDNIQTSITIQGVEHIHAKEVI
jgi:translation initiation factor 2B subunit (eIF-2B alpha/beta/delta family)